MPPFEGNREVFNIEEERQPNFSTLRSRIGRDVKKQLLFFSN